MDAMYKCAIQNACHRFLLTYSLLRPACVRHATTEAQVCEGSVAMAPS